jgi:multidrug efflux pump
LSRKFTDIFIKRPVLATVVSLLILLVGFKSLTSLQLREYPKMDNTVITVTTAYPGASPQLIQAFITEPIEKSIATAEGLDYVTSSSTDGVSTISANIRLNYDPEKAFTNIMSKVAEVEGNLPKESQQPVIVKTTGSKTALLYLAYQSAKMTPQQVTNYISRVIQPVFVTVPGVAQAQLMGGGYTYAMRIWLNPQKMAALGVSPADISKALQDNNFQSAAGATKGEYTTVAVRATTDLNTVKEFKNIVIKQNKGQLVHLSEVAKVVLGQEDYNGSATYNNKLATYVAIMPTPTANPLVVIKRVRTLLKKLEPTYPSALKQYIVYDATRYIHDSLVEVISTIIEAAVIVMIVILLFLGSPRTVLIPLVTIPLSLVGVMTIMLALGYSLNLLTLLAMVLAIGLVVDDAIVVVENVHRHIELGLTPFKAALTGAREIATPVIAMTITLAAVYAPIGFMQGVTGALFTQFAFTLAATVIVSGVVALTLSPMMCSKLFRVAGSDNAYTKKLDHAMDALRHFYERRLTAVLNMRSIVLVVGAIILVCCYIFFIGTPSQLTPQEDQSMLWLMAAGPQASNINYTMKYSKMFAPTLDANKDVSEYFMINGFEGANTAIGGIRLSPWGDRKLSEKQILGVLQGQLSKNPGLRVNLFEPPSLPVGGGFFPIDFVVKSTGPFQELYTVSNRLLDIAKKSGKFMFIQNSLMINKPQVIMHINRDKAAEMGVSMVEIGNSLSAALSGGYVNRFSMEDQSFKVIPQLGRDFRLNPQQLAHIYVTTLKGDIIPLSTLVTLSSDVQPSALTQFQQLNSATLQGMMMPGTTSVTALNYLASEAKKILPPGMSIDYAGKSRVTMEEGSKLTTTFFFSLIVIFLVLAAQFESFTDPITILVSVPMSIFGALIPLFLGAATINIYTQIGLITLIGLISKHGILMVDFANHLQKEENLSKRAAIIMSAGIRLRPILMTTAAMILGVVPLIIASGAGAVSRHDIGIVIAFGMFIGTIFTLFVVPTMYTFLARDHHDSADAAIETAS